MARSLFQRPVRAAFLAFAVCSLVSAADKKSPMGQGEDESVAVTATVLSPDQIREAVGSDFNNSYAVLEVRLAPKGSMPYLVHLDDFILRSESSGEHSGPFLAASQIAGAGEMVVERKYGNRSNADSPRPLEGTKLEMKDGTKADPTLDALKKKMLAEQTVSQPVSGLLFFPLAKEKPKNLILSYQTPRSRLRLSFR
ncbi:MAG TPA: hypothetical protein VHY84_16945 [Bryobacteraceae bacterium]|nr:hypothetical protein [Bryobacteraceae bacterium]